MDYSGSQHSGGGHAVQIWGVNSIYVSSEIVPPQNTTFLTYSSLNTIVHIDMYCLDVHLTVALLFQ